MTVLRSPDNSPRNPTTRHASLAARRLAARVVVRTDTEARARRTGHVQTGLDTLIRWQEHTAQRR